MLNSVDEEDYLHIEIGMKKGLLSILFVCTFAIMLRAQVLPDALPGLELWLSSDVGVSTDATTVTLWEDQSGNDRDASTFAAGLRPVLVNDILNGYPAVRFDGNNDFLDFPEVTNIRTVFWVLKEDPSADIAYPRCLLGHSAQADFLRGPNKVMWHPTLSADEVRNGVTRVNFTEVDGTVTLAPVNYSIVSLVTTGDCSASSLTVDRLLYERVWDGDFFEVIIYSEALDAEEVEQVELYLANKYGPAFSVSDDVILDDSFCPVTICASDGFESYAWSGGETGACLEVLNTGDYVVDVVDLFGRQLSDTVHVQFPGNTAPGDQLICLGDEWTWDTGLDNSFSLTWPDESQNPSFTTGDQGAVMLIVTDAFDCSLQTEVWVEVDEFPAQVSLGPDLELCAGNGIHITDDSAQPLEYLWSDGTADNVLIIQNSGEYSLMATNENGCLAYDTINIVVIGISPEVSFSSSGMCAGIPVQFTAINNSSDEIVNWIWEFGNGGSTGITTDYSFETAGTYSVLIIGESSTGCPGYFESTVEIHALPLAGFILPQACSNELTEFIDNSVSTDGLITEYTWNIDGSEYSGANIVAGLFDQGFHEVVLYVETEYGCPDQVEGMFQVLAPPSAVALFEGQCEGDITYFDTDIDTSESGPIVNYNWEFGDGISSGLESPSHFYSIPDIYFASLFVEAENGCADTAYAVVEISELPVIDFNTGNACSGEIFPIGAQVLSEQIVESYFWTINNVEVSQDAYILPVFDEPGFQVVGLQVVTDLGCESYVQQMIPVWPDAVALISESPEIGEAPFLAQFSASGSEASQFEWNFGDGGNGVGEEIEHEYSDNGYYEVSLIATNQYGCADTVFTNILVAIPILDLVVLNVSVDEYNGQISATVFNNGNFIVREMQLQWQQGGDSPVTEWWEGELHPGNSLIYQFYSGYSSGSANDPYICAEANAMGVDWMESSPSDNVNCTQTGELEFRVYTVFPNPVANEGSIRYSIPSRGKVEISFTDNKGSLIRRWNMAAENAGVHTFRFDAGDLPSGEYKVSVWWNDQVETKSILVLRP